MADLNDIESSQSVKIAGANSSGVESNFVDASPNGDLQVADALREEGVYGPLTVGTTATEIKVGSLPLLNRKFLGFSADKQIWIGFNSSVTSANGIPVFKDQFFTLSITDGLSIWAITTGSNANLRVMEAK